jgi:hypothetical protein
MTNIHTIIFMEMSTTEIAWLHLHICMHMPDLVILIMQYSLVTEAAGSC